MSDSAESPNELRIAEPGEACPNCGESLRGQWCYRCGQNQRSFHRFFFVLLGDLLEDVFAWNSRTAQTFHALLFRPGYLAREFFAGRRARYLPPVRVYLITSFVFFFLLSIQNNLDLLKVEVGNTGETVVLQPEPATDAGAPADTPATAANTPDANTATEDSQKDRRWTDELQEANVDLHLPWVTPEQEAQIEARVDSQLRKLGETGAEDPGVIIDAVLDVVPPAIFLLLPVFALLLKIFYFSFGFYYIEHLLLAVNNHSFVFSMLAIETLLEMLPDSIWGIDALTSAIFIWIPVYMFLSLRNVYGQGWFATLVNFSLLGVFYFVLLAVVTLAALLVGLLVL